MSINYKNSTAVLSYIDSKTNITNTQFLWIKKISQSSTLTGSIYQSKYTRHFYPRYFNLGNYVLGCITNSQESYQAVAKYVRGYHLSLANTFVTENQAVRSSDSRQYVTLQIPSEQIHVFGVPQKFQLDKKGVFDPAPTFSFEFIILYNYNKPTNYALSQEINEWYNGPIKNAYNDPRNGLHT